MSCVSSHPHNIAASAWPLILTPASTCSPLSANLKMNTDEVKGQS